MKFQRRGGGELRLSEVAVAALRAHVQRHVWSAEAGGVLLGRLLVHTPEVIVDRVTTPVAEDRRSRFAFFRAQHPAQSAVNEAWERSGAEQNYLGEWHTHPEDDPRPSAHDRRDWHRLVTMATYEQDSLFFVIVGRVMIRVWEFTRESSGAVHLPLREDRPARGG